MTPERPGRGPTVRWYRTLRYESLSTIADVWFTERDDGRTTWHLQGKQKNHRPPSRP